jgi:hypothetical protein
MRLASKKPIFTPRAVHVAVALLAVADPVRPEKARFLDHSATDVAEYIYFPSWRKEARQRPTSYKAKDGWSQKCRGSHCGPCVGGITRRSA